MISEKYEIVIGLEVHVQLQTNSKIFAPDSATFGAAPNHNISFITLGHPGTLPVVNEKVVEYAVKIGLATNCKIQEINRFARKNYFYADLPKGYQITQDQTPICYDGYVDIEVNQEPKRIRVHRIHLEEDAGKSTHDQDPKYSLIDLNRAGVPLVEIVTEPDLRSAAEAYEYVSKIRQLVQYLEISDGNMEEGSLRCDANVSVRLKGETKLGERTEVKNLNSIRNVKRAINYEAARQIKLLEKGQMVDRQTRSFDAATGTTFALRSKELAHDYRYFPEPDLQPVVVTRETVKEIAATLPALPEARIQRYTTEFGLSLYDAKVLTDTKAMSDYFEAIVQHIANYKAAANWLMVPIKGYLNDNNLTISEFSIEAYKIASIIKLVESDKISHSVAAQQLLPALVQQPEAEPLALAKSLNLLMQSDDGLIEQLIAETVQKFPDKLKIYQHGGKKGKGMIGFFMGQIMRASKVKLDPKLTKQLLMKHLDEI